VGEEMPRTGLFANLSEDTTFSGFVYASLTAALTTGLILEYRIMDPLNTYHRPAIEHEKNKAWRASEWTAKAELPYLHWTNLLQTVSITYIGTLGVLIIMRLSFGLGDSLVHFH